MGRTRAARARLCPRPRYATDRCRVSPRRASAARRAHTSTLRSSAVVSTQSRSSSIENTASTASDGPAPLGVQLLEVAQGQPCARKDFRGDQLKWQRECPTLLSETREATGPRALKVQTPELCAKLGCTLRERHAMSKTARSHSGTVGKGTKVSAGHSVRVKKTAVPAHVRKTAAPKASHMLSPAEEGLFEGFEQRLDEAEARIDRVLERMGA
jgi:hypothetical protein